MALASNKNDLSERQRKIIQFIMRFVAEKDYPPSIREIGLEVGITSTSVTNYNLTRLEELELVMRERDVSRGLKLNPDKLREFGITYAEGNHAPRLGVFENEPVRVPILGRIAAGNPIRVEAIDRANAEEYVELTAGLCRNRDRDKLFALRVNGNSMIDAGVLNGDIVVLLHQETANEGDMVAAWIEGDEETTLKHFHQRGKVVELHPANPEYSTIVRPADRVQIKGKVISVVRVYN